MAPSPMESKVNEGETRAPGSPCSTALPVSCTSGSPCSPVPSASLASAFFHRGNLGVVLHYWTAGAVLSSLNGLLQGIFLGYLNLPAYLITTANNVMNVPFIFSFLFGLLSDSMPICGRRRQPYMILGWALNTLALMLLALWPMPAPYYCVGPDGEYDMNTAPCNPEARNTYVHIMLAVGMISLGLGLSQAAADGLLVEHAIREPKETRGSTQGTLQMVTLFGQFCLSLVTAFGFNGKLYTGTFDQKYQLSFQGLCLVLLVPTTATLFLCCISVRELALAKTETESDLESNIQSQDVDNCNVEPDQRKTGKSSFGQSLLDTWDLLSSKSFFCIAMYLFWKSIADINTPATAYIQLQWAGVRMLQSQLTSVLGIAASALGMWLAKTYLLNVSWRKTLLATAVITNVLDAIPQFLTVFDVVRNQYFYLGEPITVLILSSAGALVMMQIINEVADESNAGLVTGFTSTISFVASPASSVLGVQLFGFFKPDLSNRDNFVKDTDHFRWVVAMSCLVSYGFSFLSLLFLPLLPRNKEDAQKRKSEWGRHSSYAYSTVLIFALALVYTLLVDFISLNPSLSCLKLVGGEGCS